VFVDAKKGLFSTYAPGGFLVLGNVPLRAHLELDPWLVSAGVTFKY
jgi:hypothetical protein